jgi:hypothetical protein
VDIGTSLGPGAHLGAGETRVHSAYRPTAASA